MLLDHMVHRRHCNVAPGHSRLASISVDSGFMIKHSDFNDSLIGIPSMRIVKAMAFLAKERSEFKDGNRALSWFSRKDPRRVVSPQVDFI